MIYLFIHYLRFLYRLSSSSLYLLMYINNVSSLKLFLIAAPQGGFIAPHVLEIVGRKSLTIFKGCNYSQLHIMISLSFWKIETKNLNSDPRILIFLVVGTTSPAVH